MAEPGARFPDYEVELLKVRDFLQNFEDHNRNRVYVNLLEEIADRRRLVLEVELDDVLAFKGEVDFAANIRRNTVRYTLMFEAAVDSLLPARSTSDGEQLDVFDYLMEQRQREQRRHAAPLAMGEGGEGEEAGNETPVVDLPRSLLRRFEVRILPFSAFLPKTIREIRAGDIGALVKITGMVTRSSDVKPQVAVVTYTCEICGSGIFQEVSGSQYMPLTKCSSERCKDNKSYGQLEMQSRGSKFLKYQELKVQELPNQVPVGHIPRCLVVHCHGETTRSCGPGDIVTISGIFLAVRVDGFKAMRSGLQADTYIEASKVEKVKQSYSALDAIDASRKVIDAMAGEEDRYGRLASSIAPEIFGHDDVKKALLLQLVGGATKTLADGMKIRGDINILLMGDPGATFEFRYRSVLQLILL